jgi:long-chain fatty acid transport protein
MIKLGRSELLIGLQPTYLGLKFSPDQNTMVPGDDGDASSWIPSGNAYYIHNVSPDFKVGLGVLNYFGLGLDYGSDWVGRYHVNNETLLGLSIMPTVAYKINDWFSVGAGLNLMYGKLEAQKSVNNILDQTKDGELKIEADDWGFGGNFGILVEPKEGTRLGLNYLLSTGLDFKTKPEFKDLGPGLSLILEQTGLNKTELDLGVKVPQALMFSVYHALNDKWAIMGNVGWQEWSKFGKVDVVVADSTATELKSLTVDANYKDTSHGALGVEFNASDRWLVSAGVGYDSPMFDDEDRTLALPLGDTWRYGAGAEYLVNEKITLGFAYELASSGNLPVDVKGTLTRRVSGEYKNVNLQFINVSLKWNL